MLNIATWVTLCAHVYYVSTILISTVAAGSMGRDSCLFRLLGRTSLRIPHPSSDTIVPSTPWSVPLAYLRYDVTKFADLTTISDLCQGTVRCGPILL